MPAPASRPPRWRRWLPPLAAALGLAAALAAHGPGVALLTEGEIGLRYGAPKDPTTAFGAPGLQLHLPVLQTILTLPARPRPLTLELAGTLRDGTQVSLGRVELSWRIRPADLATLVLRQGPLPQAWPEGLAATAAEALAASLAAADPARLPAQAEGLRRALEADLIRALAATGVELEGLRLPPLQIRGPAAEALERLADLEAERDALAAQAAVDGRRAAARTAAVQTRWAAERPEHLAALAARHAAASQQAEAARAEAARYRAERAAAGAAERDALTARAALHVETGRLRAQALAARAKGLAQHGERALEQAILEHILPQLAAAAAPDAARPEPPREAAPILPQRPDAPLNLSAPDDPPTLRIPLAPAPATLTPGAHQGTLAPDPTPDPARDLPPDPAPDPARDPAPAPAPDRAHDPAPDPAPAPAPPTETR